MIFLVPIVLFGWIPVILLIFPTMPPRRAVLFTFIFAWLFLPYAGYDPPGLPAYTKKTATSLGVLLGTSLFHSRLLFALRPRWFDLPMASWCLCSIASSLANGLGLYDGLSTSFDYSVTWGLPYLIGRAYFTRLEHLRELAIAIVIGGLVYIPFCAWEMRMGPLLHLQIYGMGSGWGEIAYGGYRPKVFMSNALEVGLWMCATTTAGFWLWASGSLKELWGFSFGLLLAGLALFAVLCRITGAWILLLLGTSLWFLMKWSGSRLPALGLILLPALYMGTRTSGLWTGEGAVRLVQTVINQRRAESLGFRMKNEDLLIARALEQPSFGWGGWSRARVFVNGKDITVTDGLWIITLGNNGLFGLVSLYAAMLLPMMVLVRRYPARAWRTPTLAPACVLATLANLYSIDCIANAMTNPIYILVLGGLSSALGASDRRGTATATQDGTSGTDLSELLEHFERSTVDSTTPQGLGIGDHDPAGLDPREVAAVRLGRLGRSLVEHGMMREAEEAWLSALRHWGELANECPDVPDYRQHWLDGLNDLAWALLAAPGAEAHDVARAVQLAEQAVALEPKSATYWNTLGIAYYRAGNWMAAIHALDQATDLGDGGTSFDHFFLAMAHWRQGDRDQARRWFARGNVWMEEHDPDHDGLSRFRAEARALLDSQPLHV